MRFTRTGLVTALLVIAALFVGSTLTQYLPDAEKVRLAPYDLNGSLNEEEVMRNGKVTVTRVQAAKEVEKSRQVAATPGVWLVLDVVWEPLHEPGLLSGSQPVLRTSDGRSFGGFQAITSNCGPTNPGLPVTCQLPFEVAPDALEGLRVDIPAEAGVSDNEQVLHIDLGITAEVAEKFRAAQGRIELRDAQAVAR